MITHLPSSVASFVVRNHFEKAAADEMSKEAFSPGNAWRRFGAWWTDKGTERIAQGTAKTRARTAAREKAEQAARQAKLRREGALRERRLAEGADVRSMGPGEGTQAASGMPDTLNYTGTVPGYSNRGSVPLVDTTYWGSRPWSGSSSYANAFRSGVGGAGAPVAPGSTRALGREAKDWAKRHPLATGLGAGAAATGTAAAFMGGEDEQRRRMPTTALMMA